MSLRLLALACVLAPAVTLAQPTTAQTPVSATDEAGHRLEIRDGAVWLDGAMLPGAAPADLDLVGISFALDYSGPITPVVEVDGQPYVLEDNRLVRFEESSRARERVYIMGDVQADPNSVGQMGDDRLALVSQEAYLRELEARDQALFEKMQHEQSLERDVMALADRFQQMPEGAERTRLHGDLRSRLSDLFTLKQQIRREEVDRAQAELDSVRALLDERDARHQEIVDGRLRELCERPTGDR